MGCFHVILAVFVGVEGFCTQTKTSQRHQKCCLKRKKYPTWDILVMFGIPRCFNWIITMTTKKNIYLNQTLICILIKPGILSLPVSTIVK